MKPGRVLGGVCPVPGRTPEQLVRKLREGVVAHATTCLPADERHWPLYLFGRGYSGNQLPVRRERAVALQRAIESL